MSKHHRRTIGQLIDDLDDDEGYFRQRPHRRFRLRRPLKGEIKFARRMGAKRPDYIVVEKWLPGFFSHMPLWGPINPDADWSDDAIRLVIEAAVKSGTV